MVDVLGLGYCVYDILAIVPGWPGFDHAGMTPLTDLVHDGGGQVGTALTAMARLGTRSGYIGVVGDDVEGRWLREQFVKEGVDVAHMRVSEAVGTNVCLILVDQASAQRTILCHRRTRPADLTLSEADRGAIQAARVLHLDGQFMPAAIEAAGWARAAGVKVCYDGNRPRKGLDELLPVVDWLVVAEAFAAAYTRRDDLEAAAQSLLAEGPEVVAVTLGERGCWIWMADGHLQSPGFDVAAVDTTGAGDAFHGAFIHGMLQGWEMSRVAAFANAAAALNCLMLGGRRGLPSAEQVRRLVEGASR